MKREEKETRRKRNKEIGQRIKDLNLPIEDLSYVSGISEKRLHGIIDGSEFTLEEFITFIKRTGISGDYAIVDMKELDELRSLKSLFSELEKGEVSARKKGWIPIEDAEKRLGL